MRARNRALASIVLVLACTPAGPAPSGRTPPAAPPGAPAPEPLPARQPLVRVGILVDTTTLEVSATQPFTIRAGNETLARADAGERWSFRADNTRRILGESGSTRIEASVAITIEPGDGAPIMIGGKPYRGTALISSPAAGRLTAVNVVDMEAYLLGVVPAEIPSLHVEAVKAQAVAARTYAVGNMGRRDRLGFDFYATVADQVYGGVAREDTMATRAVRETRGEIVTHDGVPILAYYHSTCGGATASVDQVWRRAPLPYLVSISDAKPNGDGYYCDFSSRFNWREEWTGEQLTDILAQHMSGFFNEPTAAFRPIEAVEIEERTTSGRVKILRIRANGTDYRIRGDSIRWFLRPADGTGRILNSVLFDVAERAGGGRIQQLTVDGHGWGHGIGMCQVGAIGRARAGFSYRDILTTYYRGTQVTKLY